MKNLFDIKQFKIHQESNTWIICTAETRVSNSVKAEIETERLGIEFIKR